MKMIDYRRSAADDFNLSIFFWNVAPHSSIFWWNFFGH
jgi:hypothetical protein